MLSIILLPSKALSNLYAALYHLASSSLEASIIIPMEPSQALEEMLAHPTLANIREKIRTVAPASSFPETLNSILENMEGEEIAFLDAASSGANMEAQIHTINHNTCDQFFGARLDLKTIHHHRLRFPADKHFFCYLFHLDYLIARGERDFPFLASAFPWLEHGKAPLLSHWLDFANKAIGILKQNVASINMNVINGYLAESLAKILENIKTGNGCSRLDPLLAATSSWPKLVPFLREICMAHLPAVSDSAPEPKQDVTTNKKPEKPQTLVNNSQPYPCEISIIIPAYNSENVLAKCLASIFPQLEKSIELIIIDDASTDATPQIAFDLCAAKHGCSLFRMPHNRKQGACRNFGISRARGRHIMFVDSDDELPPGCLKKILEFGRVWPDALHIFSFTVLHADGSYYYNKSFRDETVSQDTALSRWIAGDIHIAPFARLIPRAMLENIFFPEDVIYEDFIFAYKLLKNATDIMLHADIVYLYYINDGSSSRKPNFTPMHLRSSLAFFADVLHIMSLEGASAATLLKTHACWHLQMLLLPALAQLSRREEIETGFWERLLANPAFVLTMLMQLQSHIQGRTNKPGLAKPLLSIIIPVFNQEKLLPRCVRSVTSQSFGNYEIIIVDDASTDDTALVLDTLARTDGRIRPASSLLNRGQGACRNIGLKMARGEYIMFMDSDDYILSGFLDIAMTRMLRNPSLSLARFGGIVDWEGQTPGVNDFKPDYAIGRDELLTGGEMLQRYVQGINSFYTVWGAIYKQEFFRKNNIFFPEHFHEDNIFLMETFAHAPLLALDSFAGYARTMTIHPQSTMNAPELTPRHACGIVRMLFEVCGFLRKQDYRLLPVAMRQRYLNGTYGFFLKKVMKFIAARPLGETEGILAQVIPVLRETPEMLLILGRELANLLKAVPCSLPENHCGQRDKPKMKLLAAREAREAEGKISVICLVGKDSRVCEQSLDCLALLDPAIHLSFCALGYSDALPVCLEQMWLMDRWHDVWQAGSSSGLMEVLAFLTRRSECGHVVILDVGEIPDIALLNQFQRSPVAGELVLGTGAYATFPGENNSGLSILEGAAANPSLVIGLKDLIMEKHFLSRLLDEAKEFSCSLSLALYALGCAASLGRIDEAPVLPRPCESANNASNPGLVADFAFILDAWLGNGKLRQSLCHMFFDPVLPWLAPFAGLFLNQNEASVQASQPKSPLNRLLSNTDFVLAWFQKQSQLMFPK